MFIFPLWEKFEIWKNFIKWLTNLLTSAIINGGTTSKQTNKTSKQNFKLKKGTRQEDPISAFLLMLVLEVVFAVIKSHKR